MSIDDLKNQSNTITISDKDGNVMVAIDANEGKIHYGEKYSPDEAAKIFWEAMYGNHPSNVKVFTFDYTKYFNLFRRIKASLNLIISILKHKYYVCIAGKKLGYNFYDLIKHDMSKFSIAEFPYYVKKFNLNNSDGFTKALNHHYANNKHHVEYWENHWNKKFEVHMPTRYIDEMIADWMASCKTYNGFWPSKGNWTWGEENLERICNKLNMHSCNYLLNNLNAIELIDDEKLKELYK